MRTRLMRSMVRLSNGWTRGWRRLKSSPERGRRKRRWKYKIKAGSFTSEWSSYTNILSCLVQYIGSHHQFLESIAEDRIHIVKDGFFWPFDVLQHLNSLFMEPLFGVLLDNLLLAGVVAVYGDYLFPFGLPILPLPNDKNLRYSSVAWCLLLASQTSLNWFSILRMYLVFHCLKNGYLYLWASL